MNRFDEMRFIGDFRTYQQRVLRNADKYLKEGKINIVATPGSGKNILGLELIRRLGEPCLILSPDKDSRDQWGECLKEHFLEEESQFEEFFSTDLHRPKLINCITYQALCMAMEHVSLKEEGEVDCSDINLQKVLHKQRIKTICLDEAHHLQDKWHRSLEKFLNRPDEDVKWIYLTANPPAAADGIEWERYYDICGKRDEEIYVPELVARGDLCPHQDYVYFNFPTAEEAKVIQKHNEYVGKAVKELSNLKCIQEITDYVKGWESKYESYRRAIRLYSTELEALLVLLRYLDRIEDNILLQRQLRIETLPQPSIIYFQRALEFLVDDASRLRNFHNINRIRDVLERYSLCKDKKVNLLYPEEIQKIMVSSVGKLKSIEDITLNEYRNLRKDLRMLILTDFNRGSKENLGKIGTDEAYQDISTISIFETLRRMDDTLNIGVLSGGFIILPGELVSQGTMINLEPFERTRYAKVEVYGSAHEGMNLVKGLLKEGKLQVLIGTNMLLKDGWDETCINTLILAGSVEPFHNANQMRGWVIRPNSHEPYKTTNIWHLVTIEPQEGSPDITQSYDFEIVKQRFDTFMGPHYETGEIQNGMDRVTPVSSPFDEDGIRRINSEMLELSRDRSRVNKMWKEQLEESPFRVIAQTTQAIESDVSAYDKLMKEIAKSVQLFWNRGLILLGLIITGFIGIRSYLINENLRASNFLSCFSVILLASPFVLLLSEYGSKIKLLSTRKILKRLHRRGRCNGLGIVEILAQTLQKTMEECGMIASNAFVTVEREEHSNVKLRVQLRNATLQDQEIFNKAIEELMGQIEAPQYLLVPKDKKPETKTQYFLACPSIIGKEEEYVKVFEKHLLKSFDLLKLVDTETWEGIQLMKQYRRNHYVRQKKEKEQDKTRFGKDIKYIIVKETNTQLLEDKEQK